MEKTDMPKLSSKKTITKKRALGVMSISAFLEWSGGVITKDNADTARKVLEDAGSDIERKKYKQKNYAKLSQILLKYDEGIFIEISGDLDPCADHIYIRAYQGFQ